MKYCSVLLILTLCIVFGDSQPRPGRRPVECNSIKDCAPGYHCITAPKFRRQICARKKGHRSLNIGHHGPKFRSQSSKKAGGHPPHPPSNYSIDFHLI